MFSAATVFLVVTVAAALYTNAAPLARGTRFFNLLSVTLLALVITGLVTAAVDDQSRDSSAESTDVEDIPSNIQDAIRVSKDDDRPDIFYILFDEYARHDALIGFVIGLLKASRRL